MKRYYVVLIFILSIVALMWSLNEGMKRSERIECIEWQRQYRQLAGPALLEWVRDWQPWQAEQCKAANIKVWSK